MWGFHQPPRDLPASRSVSNCHPGSAESSAARTTPNEGPMHLHIPSNSIDPSSRKKRAPQDDNLMKTEACHAERSEQPASPDARESKHPIPADIRQQPGREFSPRQTSANSLKRRSKLHTDTGSFDSASRVASDSGRSAQDDTAGRDVDAFQRVRQSPPTLGASEMHD